MGKAVSEEGKLLEFLYAAPVGLIEIDAAGEITMMNPHAMKHLLPLAGMRDIGNLFAILETCAPELRNLFDTFTLERGTVCDGHRIVVELTSGIDGGDPKVLACTLVKLGSDRAIATLSDITAQVAQERRLKQVDTWFASLLNDVNDYAVLTISADGVVEAANASWARQTGHAVETAVGRPLSDIMQVSAGNIHVDPREQLRLAERDGWHLDQSWHYRSDGSRYRCQRLLAARTDGCGARNGYTLVLRDIVPQTHDAEDLVRRLTQDHLTGAANRAHFQDLLEREQRAWRERSRALSVIMIDIDHFKLVNDRYGHPTGDAALTEFAHALANAIRTTDVLARLGGDEFAVLLPDTSLAEAADIAERLRGVVAAVRVQTANGPLAITASFGCAAAHAGRDMLRDADDALYVAKRRGRNRVHASGTTPLAA